MQAPAEPRLAAIGARSFFAISLIVIVLATFRAPLGTTSLATSSSSSEPPSGPISADLVRRTPVGPSPPAPPPPASPAEAPLPSALGFSSSQPIGPSPRMQTMPNTHFRPLRMLGFIDDSRDALED